MVLLQWFISAPGRFKFKYEHMDCFWIDVEAIIFTDTLSRDLLTKVYEIDHVDGMPLDKFVASQTWQQCFMYVFPKKYFGFI